MHKTGQSFQSPKYLLHAKDVLPFLSLRSVEVSIPALYPVLWLQELGV